MLLPQAKPAFLKKLIQKGIRLPLATQNYPSRGQTAVQDLFQTSQGKLFLKKSSNQNHIDCQVDIESGTLAEREFWSYRLAAHLGLNVPSLWLLDKFTTLQRWLDLPDARQFATSEGKLDLDADNVFDCCLFDWLTGQIDRHDANYLYDYINRRIILIDSAHCFLRYTGSIPDYLRYFEIGFPKELLIHRSTPLSKAITHLLAKDIAALVPLKRVEEAAALEARLFQAKALSSIKQVIQLYRGKKT